MAVRLWSQSEGGGEGRYRDGMDPVGSVAEGLSAGWEVLLAQGGITMNSTAGFESEDW